MLLLFSLVILGFIVLILGANALIDGSSALAKRYNVSDLAIGLTIVAFGTSAPELIVNTVASYQGHYDIVLGNVIGSNNFNLFFILGIAGLIYPIKVQSSTAWKEIPVSLVVTVIFLLLANNFFTGGATSVSRIDGLILLVLFVIFLYYVYAQMQEEEGAATKPTLHSIPYLLMLIVLGLGGLMLGGQLVVRNSIKIASEMGVSDKVIGLTIIAAGTSLPELITSVIAATKKNSDIAIGNVIGSNIFNILFILSLSSIITPIEYNPKFNLDLYLLLGGTLFLLLGMITGTRRQLDRWEAAILLIVFVLYTVFLIYKEI